MSLSNLEQRIKGRTRHILSFRDTAFPRRADVGRGGRSVVQLRKVARVGQAQSQDQDGPFRFKVVSGGLDASCQKGGEVDVVGPRYEAVIINWESRMIETVRAHIDAEQWRWELGNREGKNGNASFDDL